MISIYNTFEYLTKKEMWKSENIQTSILEHLNVGKLENLEIPVIEISNILNFQASKVSLVEERRH